MTRHVVKMLEFVDYSYTYSGRQDQYHHTRKQEGAPTTKHQQYVMCTSLVVYAYECRWELVPCPKAFSRHCAQKHTFRFGAWPLTKVESDLQSVDEIVHTQKTTVIIKFQCEQLLRDWRRHTIKRVRSDGNFARIKLARALCLVLITETLMPS